jgi:predicted chitinase
MTANNTTQTTYIPKFSYPFAQKNKTIYKDRLGSLSHGNYLFTKMGFWHGGIHFEGSMLRDLKAQEGIKCIADGEIVAYRINNEYLNDGRGLYSTGFFLIKHKIEYPKNNKLTFFSLYMHTAKKDDYINKEDYLVKTKGENILLRSGYERRAYSPAVGDAIAANTKIIIDGKWIQNRARVLYVEGRDIDLSLNLTIHNSNVSDINKKDIPKLEEIFVNKDFNKVIVLSTPIKIKAGETIGLMGEYNIEGERNVNCLHLEVFASEQFKTFVQIAQRGDKRLPQSFDWATMLDAQSSRDHVSIFENLEAVFKKENLRMNEVFRKLFDLIDKGTQDNGDGILEVHEIEEATENPKIKDITNKYVVKHSSEWDKTQNMVDVLQKIVDNIDNSEFENKDEYIEMLKKEKKRIENLSFFNECRTIPDFPKSDMVYVVNPIGLVNEFSNCKITMEQLKQIFKNATQIQLEGVCNEINKDCKKYELDTPLKRAHFFAQVYGETGSSMKPINESWEYSPEALKSFSKYYREHPLEAIEDGYLRDKGKIIRSANQENIGKKHFGKLNGNRTEYPEDGYNFRGRGLIQLTGYEKYSKFKEEYNLYWEGMPPDTVNNPDIINEFPYSIRSAIWFWAFYRKAYFEAKNEQDSTLVKITALINGGSTGIDDRREGFKLSYGVFK